MLSAVEVSTFQVGGYVITDGTRYDFADAAEYEMETMYDWTSVNGASNLKDTTYDIYLDQYGYAIGVVEVDAPDNYLFITGVDTNTNNRYDVRADATAIFLDGTMASIEIDMTKADDETVAALTKASGDGNALVNQWFTYTVNNSDVYTVDLVGEYKDIDDKDIRATAAQEWTESKADIADIEEISKESIILRGGAAKGDAWYNVYGNDESIYLTAEISLIDSKSYGTAGVISDVESVVVGVDNANIDIWDLEQAQKNVEDGPAASDNKNVAHGVYTLFDDDGYVIAAVVVGEDAGSVTNLVYAHTGDLESESYDKNAEEYTWTRKVIFNGEETELTEVGDSLSELKTMVQHNWYEVKYNADGEVKSVKLAETALTDTTVAHDEYVDNILDLNDAMNDNDVVLYEAADENDKRDGTNELTTEPSFSGRTFYVDTKNQRGFRVDEDVKIVFIQTNNNRRTVTYDEGYQRLERVIDRLHENAKNSTGYWFEVSAIMDNYSASVVVIRDLNNAGATVTPPTGGVTLPDEISISTATMTVNVPVFIEDKDKVNDLAREALQNAGYTVTGVEVNGVDSQGNTRYQLTAAKDGVEGYKFNTNATVYVTVSLEVADEVANNPAISEVKLSKNVVAVGSTVTVTITKGDGSNFTGVFKSQSYESDGTTSISDEKTSTAGDASPLTFEYKNFTQDTIIRVYQ